MKSKCYKNREGTKGNSHLAVWDMILDSQGSPDHQVR